MVTVQSRYTVIPSEPTPKEKLFSLCEQIKLPTHAPLLYVYKHHRDDDVATALVHTLKNSLAQALVIYYPLAGRLSSIDGARWELQCNAKGAQFLEAKCEETKLYDLGDFVPNRLVSQLIPNVNENGEIPIEDMPLLAVQLTRFACGGFTIGLAICRAAIDGTATMRLMSTWAKLARGEGLVPTEMPRHDRTLLDSRKWNHDSHEHSEFDPPPLWLGDVANADVDVAVVKLTGEQVNKLKKKVNNNVSAVTQRPYSTFEVISGYLWRCVTKARYAGNGNGNQLTRLSTLVNCRNRLQPPLPDSYAGNAAIPTVTPISSFDDVIHMPLSYAVGNVRKALERVTGEFVSSTLDYIAREKDMKRVRYNFHYPARIVREGPFKGNPNFFVVSWMNFSFKDADFGWGTPVHFGPGYMDSEGKAFVLNNASGDGVFVAICLNKSHMDAFKKLFYDDIEEVFPASRL